MTTTTTATETTNETTQEQTTATLRQAYEQLPEPERYSDVGDAMLTQASFHTVLRHSDEMGGWLSYEQGRWSRETAYKAATQAVQQALHTYASDNVGMMGQRGGEGDLLFRHLHTAFNRIPQITVMLQSQRAIVATARQFDTQRTLLNCLDVVVDLRTGEMQPHSPALYMTKQTPYRYEAKLVADYLQAHTEQRDAEAQAVWQQACPKWLGFLNDVFVGDAELIDWLHRALGYLLTGDTSEQLFFVLHGGGRNGKSQLLNVLNLLLGGGTDEHHPREGSYAASVVPEVFVRNSRAASNVNGATPELAKLEGVRLAWSEEPESSDRGMVLAGATIKRLTGSTPLTARMLHRNPVEFTPRFKPVLAVNHLPRVTEDTDGMWRRIRAIPFKARFEAGKNAIKDYGALLVREEGPAILAWLVAGAVRWHGEGLAQLPRAVREKTDEYKQRDDPYFGFFTFRLVRTGDGRDTVPQKAAYEAFSEWRTEHASEIREALRMDTPTNVFDDLRPLPAVSARKFGEMLDEHNYSRKHTNSGQVVEGARLLSEAEAQEAHQAAEHARGDDDTDPPPTSEGKGREERGEADPESDTSDASGTPKQKPLREPSLGTNLKTTSLPSLPSLTPTAAAPLREPEPADERDWDTVLALALAELAVCAHPADKRKTVRQERIVRCDVCGATLGEATPAPDGCRHAEAQPYWTAETPDEYGEYPSSVTCDVCGQSFTCTQPETHRATWDSLGCPTCDAAWRYRQGPDSLARWAAEARETAEQRVRSAVEARWQEAEWQAEQAAKARRLTDAQAAVEAAEAAFAAAFGSPSAPVRFVREALSFGLHDEAYGDETPYGTTRDHLAEQALDTYNEAHDPKRASEYGDTSVDSVTYVADRLEVFKRLVARGILVPGGYTLRVEGEAVVTVPVPGGYTLAPEVLALGRAIGVAHQELRRAKGEPEPVYVPSSTSGGREYTFTPATAKQQAMLRSLGYDGAVDVTKLDVGRASYLIDWYKHGRGICMLAAEEVTRRLREQPEHAGMSN